MESVAINNSKNRTQTELVKKDKMSIDIFRDTISKEDVETVVKRALGSNAKIINYSVKAFSEEKVGFMGSHQFLTVTITRGNRLEKEIHAYFLKTIPYGVESQVSVIESCDSFFKEANFYKHIAPELMLNSKNKSWSAQCYLAKNDVLVFENLKARNFDTRDKILDLTSLKSALNTLATLHCASILAEKRLGKTFMELYPEAMKECIFSLDSKNKFRDWFLTGVNAVIGVADHLGLESKSISKICHRIFEKISASKKWRNVVCHGDLWSYNMMFDNAKPLNNCVLVDFQLTRYASAMADVAQLLYLTVRKDTREKIEMELLKFYHDRVCEILRENNEEREIRTFDDCIREFEEMRIVGIVTASIYIPINSVESNMCANLTQDSDGFLNLLFRERVKLVLQIMENDALYRDKITEVVQEMVTRSAELLSL